MGENLIVGAGAVGTVLATYLGAARQPVRMVIRPSEVDANGAAGKLRVERITGRPPLTAAKPGLTTTLAPDTGDNIFLCVKHRDLASVLDQLPPELPAGVTLLPCLNGIGVAHELRHRFPGAEVAAVTIMFNAQLLEPLHARITTRPEILINSSEKRLLRLFDGGGLKVRRAGDESLAWGKLLINLSSAACALTHTTFRDLVTDPDMSACFVALLDEATAVLDAAGVDYRLPVASSYRRYRRLLGRGGRVPWWFSRYRNGLAHASFPSMVADVEHGKTTEVEQLNGEIVRLASTVGMDAPLNQLMVELITELEGVPQDYFLSPAALRRRMAAPESMPQAVASARSK